MLIIQANMLSAVGLSECTPQAVDNYRQAEKMKLQLEYLGIDESKLPKIKELADRISVASLIPCNASDILDIFIHCQDLPKLV